MQIKTCKMSEKFEQKVLSLVTWSAPYHPFLQHQFLQHTTERFNQRAGSAFFLKKSEVDRTRRTLASKCALHGVPCLFRDVRAANLASCARDPALWPHLLPRTRREPEGPGRWWSPADLLPYVPAALTHARARRGRPSRRPTLG